MSALIRADITTETVHAESHSYEVDVDIPEVEARVGVVALPADSGGGTALPPGPPGSVLAADDEGAPVWEAVPVVLGAGTWHDVNPVQLGIDHFTTHYSQSAHASGITAGMEYYFSVSPVPVGLTVTVGGFPEVYTAPFYWIAPRGGDFEFNFSVGVNTNSLSLKNVIERPSDRTTAAVLAGGDVAIPDGRLYMRAENGNLCGLRLVGPDNNGRYSLSIVPEGH